MTEPLHNSRYSLNHAKRRIAELDGEFAAFVQSDPYSTVIEPDEDGTTDVHKLKLAKPMPVALPGIAFDALNNLRSALDQAGYAVGVAAGTRGRNAKFPFGDTVTEVESRIKHQSKDIPKEVFEVMVALQPYKGGNDLLWALNKACNTNKHEIILPIAMATGLPFSGSIRHLSARGFSWPPIWDRAKNEMILARVLSGSNAQYNLNFTAFVAMGNIEGVAGKPAVRILHAMSGEVERSLMAIEAEARRIGLFK